MRAPHQQSTFSAWDYLAWTAMADGFVTALKSQKLATPDTGYTVVITGVASPKATEAPARSGVNLKTKALPGPLQ